MVSNRILLVVNPNSGKMKAKQDILDVINNFSKHGYQTVIYTTQERGDGTRLVLENAQKDDIIVCCGGDGTLNEVITGIMGLDFKPVLGYLPSGTTNDFATSLNIPKDMKEASERIVAGNIQTIDVGKFNYRYFSYIASFGAFTETSYKTPQFFKNVFGHLAYILEGIKEIPSIKAYQLKVETKEKVIEGEYIFGAISNSTSIAGIVKLDTDLVDFKDGLFEVILVKKPQNIIDLNKILLSISSHNYDKDLFVFEQTSSVKIISEENMPWTLDGEYEQGDNEVNIQNIAEGIKIII